MAKSGGMFRRRVTKMGNTRLTTTINRNTGKVSHSRSQYNPITGKSTRKS